MKKLLSVAAGLLFAATSFAGGNGTTSVEGHDEPVQGGFFLDLQIGSYGSNYLVPTDSEYDYDDEFKTGALGFGFEVGTMFQLSDLGSGGDMGLGIRAIWFGFGVASGSNDLVEKGILNFSFISPGIYFTKALGDNAVDVFVNYVPTVAGGYVAAKDSEDTEFDFGGGNQIKLGATFRTGIFMAGLEYNMGALSIETTDWSGETSKLKYGGNHMKVLVGMKF